MKHVAPWLAMAVLTMGGLSEGCLFSPPQAATGLSVDNGDYTRQAVPAPNTGNAFVALPPRTAELFHAQSAKPKAPAPVTALGCGTAQTGITTTTASYAAFSCSPGVAFNGTETSLALGQLPAGDVAVTLKNFDNYPFIAIVRDTNGVADPNACVAGNYYAVRFTADGNATYHAIVDQDGAIATMTFDALMTCNVAKTETSCTDGWDNDANWSTDCADPACVGTSACPNGVCQGGKTLACGDMLVPGTTADANATNAVISYACPYQGEASISPEYAYRFTATTTGLVTFTVSDFYDYPMLFVLEDTGTGCNPRTCIAQNYYSAKFAAVAGHSYYLVVDGKSGKAASYNVSVVCNAGSTESDCGNGVDDDGDGIIDCYDTDCKTAAACTNIKTAVSTAPLACGTKLLHGDSSTAAGTSNFNSYPPAPNLRLPGRELIYKLPTVTKATPMLITVNDQNAYVVVSVVLDTGNGCDAGQTVVQTFYNATFTAQPGVSYCVAVEGYHATSVQFDVSLVCNPTATEGAVTGACTDKIDNDGNLQWDCADASCASACDQPNKCSAAAAITCGTTLLAGDTNTTGSSNAVDWYGCAPGQATTGREYTYSFVATTTGSVLFTLSNESYYGLIAVLPDSGKKLTCDPYFCTNLQYYSTKVDVVAGQTYYVVVDRPDPGRLTYKLSVVCNPPASETNCTDGIDNDGNFQIDCADPNCHCP